MQDLESLSRKELQQLAKECGIKANGKSADIVKALQAHLATKASDSKESKEANIVAEKEIVKKSESVENLVPASEEQDDGKAVDKPTVKFSADLEEESPKAVPSTHSTPNRKSLGLKRSEQEILDHDEKAETQSLDRNYAVKKMRKEEESMPSRSGIPKKRSHGKVRPETVFNRNLPVVVNSQPACPLPSKENPQTEFTFQFPKPKSFDLQESLKKPLNYKPHTESRNEITIAKETDRVSGKAWEAHQIKPKMYNQSQSHSQYPYQGSSNNNNNNLESQWASLTPQQQSLLSLQQQQQQQHGRDRGQQSSMENFLLQQQWMHQQMMASYHHHQQQSFNGNNVPVAAGVNASFAAYGNPASFQSQSAQFAAANTGTGKQTRGGGAAGGKGRSRDRPHPYGKSGARFNERDPEKERLDWERNERNRMMKLQRPPQPRPRPPPPPPPQQLLQQHQKQQQQQQHSQPRPPPSSCISIVCDPCEQKFTSKITYDAHLQAHKKCPHCSFSALSKPLAFHISKSHSDQLYIPDTASASNDDGTSEMFAASIPLNEDPDEVAAWIAERRKRYPSDENKRLNEENIRKLQTQLLMDQTASQGPTKVHNPTSFKACKFYLKGKCKKDLECPFQHSIPLDKPFHATGGMPSNNSPAQLLATDEKIVAVLSSDDQLLLDACKYIAKTIF